MGIFSKPKLKVIEISGKMKQDFPNFYNWIKDQDYLESQVSINDSNVIEFKLPITTFGNIMGYLYCGIEKSNQINHIYLNAVSRTSKKIIGKRTQIYKDESVEVYDSIFKDLSIYLMLETDYSKITTGEL